MEADDDDCIKLGRIKLLGSHNMALVHVRARQDAARVGTFRTRGAAFADQVARSMETSRLQLAARALDGYSTCAVVM